MRRLFASLWSGLSVSALMTVGSPLFAEGDSVGAVLPAAWLAVDYGLTTYKSKLVESNDTGSMLNYSIGANVGAQKTFGLVIRTDSSAIAFALNESAIASTWRDTVIRWRWGYAYLGGVLGQTTFKAETADEVALEGTGTGYGGNFGIFLPVGKGNAMQLDVTSVTIGEFSDAEQRSVTFGPRTDINISGQIELARRMVHSIVGYRYRTHALKAGDVSAAELHTATWFGLSLGAEF
jgi:hypothetical protein